MASIVMAIAFWQVVDDCWPLKIPVKNITAKKRTFSVKPLMAKRASASFAPMAIAA